MAERLVFGEADPRDYMEPLCAGCGHVRTEHYDDDGASPPRGSTSSFEDDAVVCWHGWEDDEEGCYCIGWEPKA